MMSTEKLTELYGRRYSPYARVLIFYIDPATRSFVNVRPVIVTLTSLSRSNIFPSGLTVQNQVRSHVEVSQQSKTMNMVDRGHLRGMLIYKSSL
jgi:hypothetical protein